MAGAGDGIVHDHGKLDQLKHVSAARQRSYDALVFLCDRGKKIERGPVGRKCPRKKSGLKAFFERFDQSAFANASRARLPLARLSTGLREARRMV